MNILTDRISKNFSTAWNTKPISSCPDTFERRLNLFDLVLLGIGCVIGAGIFVITGTAANQLAGPAAVFSFLITGLAMVLTALCYAEFAERVKLSGGAYAYAYAQLGEFCAFVVGWLSVLEFSASPAAVARGWSGYFRVLAHQFRIPIPTFFYSIEILFLDLDLLAFTVLLILTLIIAKGVKESTLFNHFVTGFSVIIILIVIVGGFYFADLDNWDDFAPFGVSGVITASAAVVFAFIGFESIAPLSEEVKNPGRNVPLGIILTLGIATILYMAATAAVTLMISYTEIDLAAPLAEAFTVRGQKWATILISLGAFAALTTTILVNLIAQPRVYFTMSRDGLLNPWFQVVNPRTETLLNAALFTGVSCIIVSQLLPLETLTQVVSIATLLIYAFTDAGLIIAKNPNPENSTKIKLWIFGFFISSLISSFISTYVDLIVVIILSWLPTVAIFIWIVYLFYHKNTFPEEDIKFKVPGGPVIPLLGVAFNIFLCATLPLISWVPVIVFLLCGIIYYFCYSASHSKLRPENQLEGETLELKEEGSEVVGLDDEAIDKVELEDDEDDEEI